jgi:hypothetical protein
MSANHNGMTIIKPRSIPATAQRRAEKFQNGIGSPFVILNT